MLLQNTCDHALSVHKSAEAAVETAVETAAGTAAGIAAGIATDKHDTSAFQTEYRPTSYQRKQDADAVVQVLDNGGNLRDVGAETHEQRSKKQNKGLSQKLQYSGPYYLEPQVSSKLVWVKYGDRLAHGLAPGETELVDKLVTRE